MPSATEYLPESARLQFRALPRAGIHSILDALLTVPAGYVDARSPLTDIVEVRRSLEAGHKFGLLVATVVSVRGFDLARREVSQASLFTRKTARLEIELKDGLQHTFVLRVYGSIFEWRTVSVGQREQLLVKSMKPFDGKLYIEGTRLSNAEHIARGIIAPVYAGIPGMTKAESITSCVNLAVRLAEAEPNLWLHARQRILDEAQCPEEVLLATAGLDHTTIEQLLYQLHRPESPGNGASAIRAATVLAAAAVSHGARAAFANRPPARVCAIADLRATAEQLQSGLAARGIVLTTSQAACVEAFVTSLTAPKPSATLLNGDVGTGKTLTFLIPAIAAHLCGKQVAIMAPNSLLADQLADQARALFPDVDILRVKTGRKLGNKQAVLVGTAGMATVCKIAEYIPDLVVVDEQHKLAPTTREAMVAHHTHVIEASATPIPRSLAIALYGGMDQLFLRECPVKKNVHSAAVFGAPARSQVSQVAQYAVKEGGIAAFIYPAVQPNDDDEDDAGEARALASLTDAYRNMSAMFPGCVARLHGSMTEDEKRAELAALRDGSKHYLVASSVIEVGIDLPNMRFMAVCNADRFGISQLHQLRGRLARRGGTGYFMMFVDKERYQVSRHTLERLETVALETDGFKLAEADMHQRGFGDVSGDRQTGERVNRVLNGIALSSRAFLALKIGASDAAGSRDCATDQVDELAHESDLFGQAPSLL